MAYCRWETPAMAEAVLTSQVPLRSLLQQQGIPPPHQSRLSTSDRGLSIFPLAMHLALYPLSSRVCLLSSVSGSQHQDSAGRSQAIAWQNELIYPNKKAEAPYGTPAVARRARGKASGRGGEGDGRLGESHRDGQRVCKLGLRCGY